MKAREMICPVCGSADTFEQEHEQNDSGRNELWHCLKCHTDFWQHYELVFVGQSFRYGRNGHRPAGVPENLDVKYNSYTNLMELEPESTAE